MIERCESYANHTGGAKDGGGFDFDADCGYDVLAAVCDGAGQEIEGGTPTGLWADPKITLPASSPTIGDAKKLSTLAAYRPQAGSPLLGAGVRMKPFGATNAKPVMRDFWGQAIRKGRPFVGAGQ